MPRLTLRHDEQRDLEIRALGTTTALRQIGREDIAISKRHKAPK